MPAPPTVLLADADVFIDYRESELAVLTLVTRHVGRLAIIPSVLEEVKGVTATECAQLGVEVVEVETGQMLRAMKVKSGVSFNDRLCLVVCQETGWTCVTNDGALRRLCRRHGVEICYGLSLMVELVATGVLTRRRAISVAHRMQVSNPFHINDRVLIRFVAAINRAR